MRLQVPHMPLHIKQYFTGSLVSCSYSKSNGSMDLWDSRRGEKQWVTMASTIQFKLITWLLVANSSIYCNLLELHGECISGAIKLVVVDCLSITNDFSFLPCFSWAKKKRSHFSCFLILLFFASYGFAGAFQWGITIGL